MDDVETMRGSCADGRTRSRGKQRITCAAPRPSPPPPPTTMAAAFPSEFFAPLDGLTQHLSNAHTDYVISPPPPLPAGSSASAPLPTYTGSKAHGPLLTSPQSLCADLLLPHSRANPHPSSAGKPHVPVAHTRLLPTHRRHHPRRRPRPAHPLRLASALMLGPAALRPRTVPLYALSAPGPVCSTFAHLVTVRALHPRRN
jgi:hypothetical protein